MLLTLADVQRIATEVAARESHDLSVAVTRSEGESAYAELIVTLMGCAAEPCRILIGVDREVSPRRAASRAQRPLGKTQRPGSSSDEDSQSTMWHPGRCFRDTACPAPPRKA